MNILIPDVPSDMSVVKRDGRREVVAFEKVSERLRKVSQNLSVNATAVAQKVLAQIVDGIKTSELDELTANLAISNVTVNPDYGTLAARIIISNHQKNTPYTFAQAMNILASATDRRGQPVPIISKELAEFVQQHADTIEKHIDYDRDYLLDFFGFKTLEKAYLLRDSNRKLVERPQHMWMRVSLGLWLNDLSKGLETYDMMSKKLFTHATPTLFNSGCPRQQLSSCFLLAMNDDSISGIYKTLADCALISKYAGGIGIHIHNIRAKGSAIRGTNGTSNGIVPMLRNFNATARYVDQCFTPDTIVYTLAGPKAIEDISCSDKVLTSSGFYEAVLKPVRHSYDGSMLSINGTRVTGEHPIMAIKGCDSITDSSLITFMDAKDLRVGDYIVYSRPNTVVDIQSLSADDCKFYGILVGTGLLSWAFGTVTSSEKLVVNFVKTYLSRRGITFTEFDDNIRWSCAHSNFKFTRSQVYNDFGKCIDPSFLHLPELKIMGILEGIIESVATTKDDSISITFKSKQLYQSFRYLLLRVGSLCEMTETEDAVSVTFSLESQKTIDNFILNPITDIQDVSYSGILHDFEIDEPHDYTVANLGVAHNGGGRRNGSFAIYLEPWHADIQEFLKLKLNNGQEDERARDLFYALWVSDLFMERVRDCGTWTLFCPSEAPGLSDVVGEDFKALYEKYESEGLGRVTMPAQKLWFEILDSQIETGTPYLVYKDAANRKSNQQNVGVIKSSNLCSEIIEYSSPTETAVCNLASLALPSFIKGGVFDFEALRTATKIVIRNLNRVIDINFYPTEETRTSNMRHRPVGLGVQGLADVFAILSLPWEIVEQGRVIANPEVVKLNKLIFAHMYYAAVEASIDSAVVDGPYSTFVGSPASKGLLQPDLWSVEPVGDLDWVSLRERVKRDGLRNSLLIAPMPTASTSQILGFNECFEPFTTNIYTRRTLAGEFIQVNKYLVAELVRLGVWSTELKDKIVAKGGSVQGLSEIPTSVQQLYKTVWELKQKTLIDLAADRGAYICQSQSLNLFVGDPDYSKLSSMHFYAWSKGLKTGIYYLRTKPPVSAQQFTIDPSIKTKVVTEEKECLMCSS